mmetsp:Transcript_67616/g.148294  ORF Transcript_67616/g.148294 Transcript_67616/m.148294 type:complete len:261 (+) Transcript_67616:460-1242(+)
MAKEEQPMRPLFEGGHVPFILGLFIHNSLAIFLRCSMVCCDEFLEHRQRQRCMQRLEVVGVGAIHVHLAAVLVKLHLSNGCQVEGSCLQIFLQFFVTGQLPLRGTTFRIEPDEDPLQMFAYLIGVQLGALRHVPVAAPVGHRDAVACDVEGPAVKGTLQGVAHHNAAHAQMRSHVGAEGMGNAHLSILATEGNHVGSQGRNGFHLSICQVCGIAHTVPAIGKARWKHLAAQCLKMFGVVVVVVFGALAHWHQGHLIEARN